MSLWDAMMGQKFVNQQAPFIKQIIKNCVLQNLSGPQTEHKRKAIVKVFKDCGLRKTIQANLQKVNFLAIQLDLNTSTYQPYRKPDNNPVYLTKIPITPTKVLKELPKSIEKHVSGISLNENVFTQSTPIYHDASQEWFCRATQIYCK